MGMNNDCPLLKVEDLVCKFTSKTGPIFSKQVQTVHALAGVDLELNSGSAFGVVGESGSGKSTLARCLMHLETPSDGTMIFNGNDYTRASGAELKAIKRDIQIVFQDPWASLNPRHTVQEIISEPWEIHEGVVPRRLYHKKVAELLELVGLNPNFATRFPNQFSGGQRQRISIARALALSPKVLILDEAVSALDVSVQAQILNLLQEIQEKLRTSYVFISHDLSVVRHLCDRIGVMYLGKFVEVGETKDIFENPKHPYTKALLSAMPDAPEEKRIILEGEVPSPLNPPSGCRFRTRCAYAKAQCTTSEPFLQNHVQGTPKQTHLAACHMMQGDWQL